jgi:poly-gamma-glutamate synthesis protein (capsule biosynthesis protein)
MGSLTEKTKNIVIIIAIIVISILVVLSLTKEAQAPWGKAMSKLVAQKIAQKSTSSLPVAIPENKAIEFIFGGDVMLSRQVNNKMTKYQDYSWPFSKIADYLKNADITIINLESPFVISKDYSVPTGSFLFKANPKSIIGLVDAGVDLVSLANNHTLNQGPKGLIDTFKILNDQGLKYIGAGNNDSEAHRGEIITVKNQQFGFLAYAYPDDSSVAGLKSPGIANMEIEKMKNDINRLKEQGAKVIVIMHAGTEYTTKPNQQQISFARQAIDSGAEAVIGHHPHWPQSFEFYQDKPIIYSLGNLIFDQMWSKETQQGLIAKMSWENGWEKIELVPIKIKDYGQAEILAERTEKEAILKKIGAPADGLIKK